MAMHVDPRASRAAPVTANLICMGSMFLWAAGFPAAETLLERWETLPLITARFLLAVALLLPIWLAIDGFHKVASARWGRGTLIGGIGFGLGAWLLLVAQSLTDPVSVAVAASAMPVCAAVLEVLLDRRRPTPAFLAGVALAVLGGLIAIQGGAVGGDGFLPGVAAVIASCFLFVWGSRQTVRELPDLSDIGRTTISLAGGAIAVSILTIAGVQAGQVSLPATAPDADEWSRLLIYALGSMALSQLLWLMGVTRLGVAIASFHMNTAPFYVMVILLALGQGWSHQQALGAVVVVLGVVIAQRPAPPRRAA